MHKIFTTLCYRIKPGHIHSRTPVLSIFIIILSLSMAQVFAVEAYGQQVTLRAEAISLENALKELQKQSGYNILWSSRKLRKAKPITVDFTDISLPPALERCLEGQPFEYLIEGNNVLIRERTDRLSGRLTEKMLADTLRGRVTNRMEQPLAGATVKINQEGTIRAVLADENGRFLITPLQEGALIEVTYMGYDPQRFTFTSENSAVQVVLLTAEQTLDAVTVNAGILRRERSTFTGATATYSGAELRQIGNQNIIQSLKSLDPSFIVVESNQSGSNPNTMPRIEIRGKTSITSEQLNTQFAHDPNQPLFILNGFESTLEVIYNLDMNRIASVTILKDAVSTALYGSKAANGVVVVETLRPKPGKLNINYTSDIRAEIPDLTSYNLMNAREKLEFERLTGRYVTDYSIEYQSYLDQTYHEKLSEVERGVDSYWLSEPLRTGISNNHSLLIDGGSEELSFGVGASYRDTQGAMKGSRRRGWGSNIDISYRRNAINIINSTYVTGHTADESPYGSFSDYAKINPYYRKTAADGSTPRYFERSYSGGNMIDEMGNPRFIVSNPLFNVFPSSISRNTSLSIQNNLQAIYDLHPALRLQAGLQLNRSIDNQVIFIPPEHTQFDNAALNERGSNAQNKIDQMSYDTYLMLTFFKLFQSKHQLHANVRADLSEFSNRLVGFSAVGFPNGSNGNPSFAYTYTPYERPASASEINRRNSLLASVNYAYEQRYLLDATYRLDGSTAFGSNHLYAPFGSVGIGWNLHQESFLKSRTWIDHLALRANLGYTGNQNFGLFVSTSVYSSLPGRTVFGQGLDLQALGNPNLQWQNTLQKSIGTEFAFFNNRYSGNLYFFDKTTDPLVVGGGAGFAPSIGITSDYPINVGTLTVRGWEGNIRFSPIYNPENRLVWSVGLQGSSFESKFSNFGNALSSFNEQQLNSQSLVRYHDGYGPDDIWAVRSGGIDPATGYEVFIKKDGSLTYVYDVADIVKVGNTRPAVEGVISSSVQYKGLQLGIYLRYRLNGYVFNTALYDKIEGVGIQELRYNLDRRALYDRWQQPGDITQFRKIVSIEEAQSMLSARQPTSRFVQKDSHLVGESIHVGWDFTGSKWLSKARLQGLRIHAVLNDIFRIESVLSERGIEYPFARNVSVSINAFF